MEKAVGYIRVSTSGQAGEDKISLKNQTDQITKHCEKKFQLLKIYKDAGWSGAKDKRPDLDELRAAAKRKEFQHVVVNDLTRFGRSAKDLLTNVELLRDNGVTFHCVKDSMDISSRSGKMLFTVLSAAAEFELETMKVRLGEVKTAKWKNHDIFLGNLAHGYRWNEKEKKIETVDGEAKVVSRMFQDYLTNKSISQVVEGLQADHLRTRHNKLWSIALVHQLLKNPCYTGTYITNRHILNDKGKIIGKKPEHDWIYWDIEPLVSLTDWQRVQDKLASGRQQYAGRPNAHAQGYISDGLLRCGICGGSIRFRTTRSTKSNSCHAYYACYWHIKGKRHIEMNGRTRCDMPSIPAALMDEHLFEMRLFLKLGMDWTRKYEDKVQGETLEAQIEKAKQLVENIKNSITLVKTATTNLDATLYSPNFNPDAYTARAHALDQEAKKLNFELEDAKRNVGHLEKLIESEHEFAKFATDRDKIMDLQRQLSALPIEQKRRLLRGLIDGDITVTPPTSDAIIDASEGPNALNGWTSIDWLYNPTIILDILGIGNSKRGVEFPRGPIHAHKYPNGGPG